MQQTVSPIIRQNTFIGKEEAKLRNIRAKSTGTPQVIPNNAFLKEHFSKLLLCNIISDEVLKKIINPQKNIMQLIGAATNYLALYEIELSFSPSGNFAQDVANLITSFDSLLPNGQMLNLDYDENKGEFIFIVYQPHPMLYWDAICYIPVSITETMRPKLKKLFIRFMAYMMNRNNISTIQNTYDYDAFVEDVQQSMRDKNAEVTEFSIETMRSYENKRGKANRKFQLIEQCNNYQPNELLAELKNLKSISSKESEQVQCMIRGLELMSQGSLMEYVYEDTYDNYSCEYTDYNEMMRWQDLICISYGTCNDDALIKYHFEGVCDHCNNLGTTIPYSYLLLSIENLKKLPPCTFPYEWLDYICYDFFKHLTTDE